ncbi:AI-2E family transporter, partial [Pseudomonas aeruginosa]
MLDTKLESRTFLLLLAVVTLAFGWLLLPFYGAVFWGTILAIIFAPVQRRLQVRLRDRKNLAALITLLICVLIVIIPVIFIAGSLVQEGASVYQRVKSGELNFAAYLQQAVAALPPSVHQWLERFDLANLSSLQEKLSSVAMQASQVVATKAFSIGQNTLDFVISFGIMLYLLFFLLRDGRVLGRRIKQAVPLSQEHKHHLFAKFTTVIRATVKGNIAVAATQGALGGLIFWVLGIEGALLWGT